MPFRRVPFAAADADGLVAFCVANGSPFDGAIARRLMLELTTGPEGVFVLAGDAGPALVAALFDRGENAAGAAMLEILGVGQAVPGEAFRELVIEPAIAFARAGVRRAVHVPLPHACARIDGAEAILRDAGFAPAYDSLTMRRPATAPPPPPAGPLPDGWRWEALAGARVDAAHAALHEAFRDSPSFTLSPLPLFRPSVASGASRWRALLDGEELAGLVQVSAPPASHELRTVARRPAWRGRGLGPRLVAEGLRLLRDDGARDVELSVDAPNERAWALYHRFGFEIAARAPVFALALRP
jgi:ribosomal protein S18 acetylase RimI-like enzyme